MTDLEQAIKTAEAFNAYRTGENFYPPNPKSVTKALKILISFARKRINKDDRTTGTKNGRAPTKEA